MPSLEHQVKLPDVSWLGDKSGQKAAWAEEVAPQVHSTQAALLTWLWRTCGTSTSSVHLANLLKAALETATAPQAA
ncbi:hypothetical protein COHA_006211 [Chlorella ohadii]|uniref:Uncharacterized protein n=1 Tax=Chlorella ohadii TaxID=2649997 RepID=A0AAD5H141_9CHLO|nr:hypothetical protein COHA_006211 [Chlorella ohadii]